VEETITDKKPDISRDVQERAEKIVRQALLKKPCKPLKEYSSSPPKRSRCTASVLI